MDQYTYSVAASLFQNTWQWGLLQKGLSVPPEMTHLQEVAGSSRNAANNSSLQY